MLESMNVFVITLHNSQFAILPTGKDKSADINGPITAKREMVVVDNLHTEGKSNNKNWKNTHLRTKKIEIYVGQYNFCPIIATFPIGCIVNNLIYQMSMRQLKITQSATSREDKSIHDYLSDISKIPEISMDEEIEIAQDIHNGGEKAEKAKERIVSANLRFVVSVAKQYQGMGLPLADLINEGNIGLIKAADRFDEKRGFKFISYAVWWIRQSIIQSICDQGRTVRLPLNNVALLNKYWKMHDEFMQEFQRKPSIEEFADAVNIDVSKASAIIKAAGKTSSMDAPLADDSETSGSDMMPSDSKTDENMDKESMKIDVIATMKGILKTKEMQILCGSFGIGCQPMSLDELSEKFELSRERLRQIRERSIDKLRDSSAIGMLRVYLG